MPSPGHLALVPALVSSSYFIYGNIGAAYFGVMPAIARNVTTLPVVERVALWRYFYDSAKLHMGISTSIAVVSLSVSASNTVPGTLRNILIAGAVAAAAVHVFTLAVIMPVNNDLIAMLKASSLKPMQPKDEQHALEQLDRWTSLHKVRLALGLVSCLAATIALLATGPIIQI